MAIFLASFIFNLAIALVLFIVLGGSKLLVHGGAVERRRKRMTVSVGARGRRHRGLRTPPRPASRPRAAAPPHRSTPTAPRRAPLFSSSPSWA